MKSMWKFVWNKQNFVDVESIDAAFNFYRDWFNLNPEKWQVDERFLDSIIFLRNGRLV